MNLDHLKTARNRAELRRGRTDWYRIETVDATTAKLDTPRVYIYDEIGYFGVTAQDFVKDLNEIDADEIDLRLNTPGGNVFDGLAIYNALVDHKASITATVDGLAASAGSYILQAGDKRVMNRSTEVMIHNAAGLTIGDADDHRETADRLDAFTRDIAKIFAGRSDTEVDDWLAAMKAETWYNADEAVEAGLADEVADGKTADNSFDLSIYNHAGRSEAPAPKIPVKSTVDYAGITDALRGAFV